MRNIFAYRTWLDRSWSFLELIILLFSLSGKYVIRFGVCPLIVWYYEHHFSLLYKVKIWRPWVWPTVEIRKQKEGNSKNKKKLTICSGKSAGTKVVCGKCPSGDETRARAFDLRKNPRCFQSSIIFFSNWLKSTFKVKTPGLRYGVLKKSLQEWCLIFVDLIYIFSTAVALEVITD